MASKAKSDVKILKGQEAEDAVLTYIRRMNRPFGAVDVAANMKGAVPKTAMQKILIALAEKGELTQKLYGKTTFFVVNQSKMEAVSPDKLASLEGEYAKLDEANKLRANEIKVSANELAKLKSTPTDTEITAHLEKIGHQIDTITSGLKPLRSGAPVISGAELANLEVEWLKWRTEWVKRKKVFNNLWAFISDALPPQDATALAEDLGVELDTDEHIALEKSPLCVTTGLKRKRV
ncbi:TBPIP-domain-containing protein [Athelia psychrophila]|uniref:TBPIP-domain-containing protein n=1 Tax=Athelia psychrophila TaxID=1759441 RepID=A0A167VMD9_9AGAM|nr:TBPIP-domain-containing protein [Fibularhizoctonia sp. CBS 109695]